MASNYQQKGEVITWTNATGSAVSAGQMVKIANCLGVALVDIANGASGSVGIEGVFLNIPKVSGAVFAQLEKLIWDVSANGGLGAFDDSAATPATGDVTGAAVAWAAGTDGQTTCAVKLIPGNTTVT